MSHVLRNQKKLKKLLFLKFLTIIFCSKITTKRESDNEIPEDLNTPEKFLDEFRALVPPQKVYVLRRQKNLDFRAAKGISSGEIHDIIMNKLTAGHCIDGPDSERDKTQSPGVIYEFKFYHEDLETEIYIKLKIAFGLVRSAVCISFHD